MFCKKNFRNWTQIFNVKTIPVSAKNRKIEFTVLFDLRSSWLCYRCYMMRELISIFISIWGISREPSVMPVIVSCRMYYFLRSLGLNQVDIVIDHTNISDDITPPKKTRFANLLNKFFSDVITGNCFLWN
jgi:hypothetical protein